MMPSRTITVTSLVSILLVTFATVGVAAENTSPTLSSKEAAEHVGQKATVCGVVVSAKYATSTRGEPTFLNLDEPYPSQLFTVVIWGSNRAAFGKPESVYAHKTICVTGMIEAYKGKPEIVASRPEQIAVKP
jgi:DNA/RNA endonuclease YhcR with UshA esterase domain